MNTVSYEDKSLSELLVLSQKGDKLAYQRFFEKICPIIEKRVRKKVFNDNDISDVFQNVLLSIHQSLHTYDKKRSVYPWVYTITDRRIIDYIRKLSTKSAKETLTSDGDVTIFKDIAKYDMEEVSEVLNALPENLRGPIELTKIKGYSTKEAAEILKIKENALRTRISRAIKLLKDKGYG